MERTLEEQLQAIVQIREYAATYEGKRKEFFVGLHAMLATPLLEDNHYTANVGRMYLAAIGALTAEIQPPTTATYEVVLERLNSALKADKLGPVHIAYFPDEEARQSYAVPGVEPQRVFAAPALTELQGALPRPRKLSKAKQALVNKFRAELPEGTPPFAARGPQRG